jgi:hypothetical protein
MFPPFEGYGAYTSLVRSENPRNPPVLLRCLVVVLTHRTGGSLPFDASLFYSGGTLDIKTPLLCAGEPRP